MATCNVLGRAAAAARGVLTSGPGGAWRSAAADKEGSANMENIANMEQRRGGANIASSATRGRGGAVLAALLEQADVPEAWRVL